MSKSNALYFCVMILSPKNVKSDKKTDNNEAVVLIPLKKA